MSTPTTPGDPTPQESPESGAAKPAPETTANAQPTAGTTPPAAADPAKPAAPAAADPATPAEPTTPATSVPAAAPASNNPATTDKPAAADKTVVADKTAGAGEVTAAEKPAPSGSADADKATAVGAATGAEKSASADASAEKKPAAEGGAGASEAGASGGESKDAEAKVRFWRRGPFVTVAGALVVLLVLAVLGYVWGLGPLNRLNTARGITPPAKLAGLDRVTDADIRSQLQLDQTRQALSRINNGKQATVEAYGNLDGDRLFVVIALRGKVDIAKTVADSGASPDKVKKIGQATCVETTGNLPTQCYRGSNTLTVIAQSANEGITVDQVAPVAVEAFHAMK